jgi:hypothetical protein
MITKMIEGLKSIAEELTKRTGFAYTDEAVRKLIKRENNPLPVELFDGRIGITPAKLDEWVAARKGVVRVRKAS